MSRAIVYYLRVRRRRRVIRRIGRVFVDIENVRVVNDNYIIGDNII